MFSRPIAALVNRLSRVISLRDEIRSPVDAVRPLEERIVIVTRPRDGIREIAPNGLEFVSMENSGLDRAHW
jgi:hypothetical protein